MERILEEINSCLSRLGRDYEENVAALTALTGKILSATCALYNRLDGELLCALGQWQAPADFQAVDRPEGHLCYDVISRGEVSPFLVCNLQDSPYARTDPNVSKYALQTYLGYPVLLNQKAVGSLCVVFQEHVEFDPEVYAALGIIAAVISREEERRQEEILRRESENKFEKLFYESADGILIANLKTMKFLNANRKMCDMLGYAEAELLALGVADIHPDETVAAVTEIFRNQTHAEKGFTFSLPVLRKDGSTFTAEINTRKIVIDGTECLAGIFRDITKNLETQAELNRTVDYLTRRNTELAALANLAKEVLDNNDFTSSARAIFNTLRDLTQAQAGYVALLNENGEENDVLFLESGGLPCRVDPSLPMPIRGLRAEAYRSGQVVADNDFSNSRWVEFLPSGHTPLKNVLFAPLIVEGSVAGLIGLSNKPVDFTDDDKRIALTFSHLAAIALKSSRDKALLEEREKRYHSYFMQPLFGVAFTSSEKGWLEINDRFCEILGYTREELATRTWADLTHPDDLERDLIFFNRLQAGEIDHYSLEKNYIRSDGTVVPVDLSVGCIRHQNGGLDYIVAIVRDISARKRAEEQVKTQRDTYEIIFEQSLAGYWDWLIQENSEYLSPTFKSMFGYADHELPNHPDTWQQLIFPEDLPDVFDAFHRHIESRGEVPYYNEVRYRHKDGSTVWVICTGKVIEWDEQGRPLRMVGCHIDITERKRLEEQLLNAKISADAANAAKSQFLANMSHEIRTPLNGILGMLEILKGLDPTHEQTEFLQDASTAGWSLLHLLNEILDLSKIEAGEMQIHSGVVDLGEVEKAIRLATAHYLANRDVELIIEHLVDVPRHICGDETRIRQILLNLVGNAAKFTEQGRVTLKTEVTAAPDPQRLRLRFIVEDTGIGISEDNLATIFDPFIQVDSSFQKRFQGTGLGLTIVKKLVELMNGSVTIKSTLGVGTLVAVEIDVGRVPNNTRETVISPSQTSDLGLLKLLLVEDNAVNRKIAERILGFRGYQITTAVHGRDALELAARERFDLILMDIQMPVMDGIEAFKLLRNGEAGDLNIATPVIALTAYAMHEERARFLDVGFNAYVEKPIQWEKLDEIIVSLMRDRTNRSR